MKSILVIAIILSTSFAFAQTYMAITPPDTVTAVGEVKVQRTNPVTQIDSYSLPQLDSNIAALEAQKAELQKGIDSLKAIRAKVETEAKKVSLKKVEVEPVPDEKVK